MAYVTVPKDLTKIKSKVMFNLSLIHISPRGKRLVGLCHHCRANLGAALRGENKPPAPARRCLQCQRGKRCV